MVSLKGKSDDSKLGIFLLSGLVAIVFLGIRDGIPLKFVLFVLFFHVLGSVFIWRKVEQWWFVLGHNWKRVVLALTGLFFVYIFLVILLSLLLSFLEACFGIPSEKSVFLSVIVAVWLLAFLWSFMSLVFGRIFFG